MKSERMKTAMIPEISIQELADNIEFEDFSRQYGLDAASMSTVLNSWSTMTSRAYRSAYSEKLSHEAGGSSGSGRSGGFGGHSSFGGGGGFSGGGFGGGSR